MRMEDDAPIIYGIEFQSRALTAHTADLDNIRFFVGTQCLKADVSNQIHEVNFEDETNTIEKKVYVHEDGEVWHLKCPPSDPTLLASCYNKLQGTRSSMLATIWKLPGHAASGESGEGKENVEQNQTVGGGGGDDRKETLSLIRLVNLELKDGESCNMNRVLWHPTENNELVTLSDTAFHLWDIAEGAASVVASALLEGKGCSRFTSYSWNPHQHCKQLATCNDTCVKGWDLRTMNTAYTIDHAHGQLVRDLDFNPNKQYYLATCADDCQLKFWDIRNCEKPLKSFKNHSHWVWCVRYNQSHDQLVLTSSSDWRVMLSNIMSLSSEPYGHLIEDDDDDDSEIPINAADHTSAPSSKNGVKGNVPDDGVLAKYEEHEDSVYCVEWSAADPWLFGSVSFDGRFVINRVPRQEKYKILL